MFKKLASLLDKLADSSTPAVDEEQLSRLAATALMIELCRADHQIDDAEIEAVITIAKETFQLSDQQTNDLLEDAKKSNHQATSLYEFTDVINRTLEKPAKYQLIKNIWQVAYADKKIDRHEDHLIRKIADLIYISHSDFIRAKLEVLEQ